MPKTKKKLARNKKPKAEAARLTSQEEITSSILTKIKKLEDIHSERKQKHLTSDTVAFFSLLSIILVTNFFLSLILVFLIIFLKDSLMYAIAIILGLAFGILYSNLMHGMRHLFLHHHIYAKIFIIVTGAINIAYITGISGVFLSRYGIKNDYYHAISVSLAYFISYILPYFVQAIWKYYTKE